MERAIRHDKIEQANFIKRLATLNSKPLVRSATGCTRSVRWVGIRSNIDQKQEVRQRWIGIGKIEWICLLEADWSIDREIDRYFSYRAGSVPYMSFLAPCLSPLVILLPSGGAYSMFLCRCLERAAWSPPWTNNGIQDELTEHDKSGAQYIESSKTNRNIWGANGQSISWYQSGTGSLKDLIYQTLRDIMDWAMKTLFWNGEKEAEL